jgi:hypothetical protein
VATIVGAVEPEVGLAIASAGTFLEALVVRQTPNAASPGQGGSENPLL